MIIDSIYVRWHDRVSYVGSRGTGSRDVVKVYKSMHDAALGYGEGELA